jgi:hypothetical protein
MSLSNYTDEALQEELKERAEKRAKLASVPEALPIIKWDQLLAYLDKGLKQVALGGECRAWEHCFFVEMMDVVYGHSVWRFWDRFSIPQTQARLDKEGNHYK